MQTSNIEKSSLGLKPFSDERLIYCNAITDNKMSARQRIAELEKLNSIQEKLYARAMNGLRSLDELEFANLSHREKTHIKENFVKTRHILNLLKQEVCIELTNHVFKSVFPKTDITKELTGKYTEEKDSAFRFELLTLKDLKIARVTIIDRLIDAAILPKNFYEL